MANPWDKDPIVGGSAQASRSNSPWENDEVVPLSRLRAQADARRRSANTPAALRAVTQGMSFGFSDELDALGAGLETGIANIGRRVRDQEIPYTAGEARQAVFESEGEAQRQFTEDHPVGNFALQALGGALVPGLGAAGYVRGGATGAARVARASGVGAAGGALYGAGAGEGLEGRAAGAGIGAAGGAVAGAGLQVAGQGLAALGRTPVGQAVGQGVRNTIATIAAPVRRIATRRGPEQAQATANAEIVRALQARGLNADQIRQEIQRMRSAGLEPSGIDVMGEPGRVSVRAAAGGSQGQARQMVQDYRDVRAMELQPTAIRMARELTPNEQRPAAEVAAEITANRTRQGQVDYGPAQETPVAIDERILSAIDDAPGMAALRSARENAVWNRDQQTAAEIDGLIAALEIPANVRASALGQLPQVRASTLEEVRRALRDTGGALAQGGQRRAAGGALGRATDIDASMGDVAALQPARENWRVASQAIEAAGGGNRPPPNPLTASPDELAAYVASLPPEAQAAYQVFARQALTDRFGEGVEGGVGAINRIAAGANLPAGPNLPNVRRNLEAIFGDQAQEFGQDLQLARQQVSNAGFIAPNTGSQTALRASDDLAQSERLGDIRSVLTSIGTGSVLPAITRILDRTVRSAGLNEAEREAIVRLGIGSADELERVVRVAEDAQRRGLRPPKLVRDYVTRAKGVLGQNEPVALLLERQLLLPAPVAAEDEYGEALDSQPIVIEYADGTYGY